jgi:hypothetical protein
MNYSIEDVCKLIPNKETSTLSPLDQEEIAFAWNSFFGHLAETKEVENKYLLEPTPAEQENRVTVYSLNEIPKALSNRTVATLSIEEEQAIANA